jgi:hypothetical protein
MEGKTLRKVVNDDDVGQRSSQDVQVLEEDRACEGTIFSEEPVKFIRNKLFQLVNDLIRIDGLRSSENSNFVKFCDRF